MTRAATSGGSRHRLGAAKGRRCRADGAKNEELERALLSAVDFAETEDQMIILAAYMGQAGLEPRAIVRELKAVGGDLKAVRLALTGRDRGPELAAVIAALPRDELLSRLER